MRVLAIGCHPDDIEMACAGTLAKYKKRGDDVIICHVANGNMGHSVITPSELSEIRKREAQASGSIIQAEVISCDIGDLMVYDEKEQRDKVVNVIRYVQPDIVLTHSPNDYMPDHRAVSKLVFDAAFTASVPHYETKFKGVAAITPIYFMDTLAGIDFIPTEYVDITETIDIKLQMLEKHESQIKWMRDHDGIDLSEFVRTCSRFRGIQCGVAFAEAFTQCYTWPKIKPCRLLP